MITNYEIKKDFPIFDNSNISYLDSAATAQKPKCVIDALQKFYAESNANIHRGAYGLSIKATEAYNNARHKVASFINAKDDAEIIFTKNATEALNLVAYSFGMANLTKNDNVVISIMEHHSNLVPWQKVTTQTSSTLQYLYIDKNFEIPEKELEKINKHTKIVSIVSVSNVLGTKNNINNIIKKAHAVGAVVIVDISQSISHFQFDVQQTDADFVVFSGHKMYGPLGIGVLYGKKELLEKMPPFLMGGDMIEYVYEQTTTFAELPNKFEAGTQNVAGAVGLAAAIDYIQFIGYKNIQKIEKNLIKYAKKRLCELPFVELYITNNEDNHASVISFNIKGIHPHDVSTILDSQNVCIRSGNHCAQPLMRYLNIDSTCRASLAIYNTKDDIDALISAIKLTYEKFKKYLKV